MTVNAINIQEFAAPEFIDPSTHNALLQIRLDKLVQFMRDQGIEYDLPLISDPAYQDLNVGAYCELILRNAVNDAAKQNLLAFAAGINLDHIGLRVGVRRLQIDPGDPNSVPPVEPTYEDDERLRQRIQLAPESFSTAGSEGSYLFHAMSGGAPVANIQLHKPNEQQLQLTYTFADASHIAQVRDIDAHGPEENPGTVIITVLQEGEGKETEQAVLDAVNVALNKEAVRPLTDHVTVQAANIIHYQVDAELYVYDGPGRELVKQQALERAQAYVDEQYKLGRDITRSGLDRALHVPGVQRVVINQPAEANSEDQRLVVDRFSAAYCDQIQVAIAGVDE